jgi:hypothetical protein
LKLGEFSELGQRRWRQVRQTEKDGFDARKAEVAGFERCSRPP